MLECGKIDEKILHTFAVRSSVRKKLKIVIRNVGLTVKALDHRNIWFGKIKKDKMQGMRKL